MNWPDQMEHTANHYAQLARLPAWREYARHRVREMESEEGGHWAGLLELVRKKLEEGNK